MAKTSNEELFDAMVRHQIYLLNYSGFVRNKVTAILDETEKDLAEKIRSRLRASTSLDTPASVARLEALETAIRAIRGEAWTNASSFITDEMTKLSVAEAATYQTIITSTSPVILDTTLPSARLLKAIVNSRPFHGRVLKDWVKTMADDDLLRIGAAIRTGMVSGEGMDVIVRRVIGTGTLKGSDGVTEITRRQVAAITRTAVQHIANSSRSEFLRENSDVVLKEQYVATLDGRTTPICRALDGKQFPVGTGAMPPVHFSCRSTRIAALDGALAGDRPSKPVTEKVLVSEYAKKNNLGDIKNRDDLPKGSKGAYDKWARSRIKQLVGTVPAKTTYQEWLKRQPVAFQDEVLGKAKGKLFREKGFTLDQFVTRSGQELSLDDIAAKYKVVV